MRWTGKMMMRHESDVWVDRLHRGDAKVAYIEGCGQAWTLRRPTGVVLHRGTEQECRDEAELLACTGGL